MLVIDQSKYASESQKLCCKVKEFFQCEKVIVRSSANDEDCTGNSSAGKYHSELNVNPENSDAVNEAIQKVLESYTKSISITQTNQKL